MGRRAKPKAELDRELLDLPADLRWREWMGRAEAVMFASPRPVTREVLARIVGNTCNIELLIDDIRGELRGRPYELVAVAGGWQHRTKSAFAEAIRTSGAVAPPGPPLSRHEANVLMAIAYFQPITRGELSKIFGKEISRDTIGALRADGFIGAGPRSPQPGAPYTYVTTREFLESFGFDSLRDLPDMEMLQEAGLISKEKLLAGDVPEAFDLADGEDRDGRDRESEDREGEVETDERLPG
jgi:segregation and condensation protein B